MAFYKDRQKMTESKDILWVLQKSMGRAGVMK